MHHAKLNIWVQPGGHADGDPDILSVAIREAQEESGLTQLRFLTFAPRLFHNKSIGLVPFDLDVHRIPPNLKDPAHVHFDVRYIVVANEHEIPITSDESHDLRWFTLHEARRITSEVSMHRQFAKLDRIRTAVQPYDIESMLGCSLISATATRDY
jgi:8-oxo-dGTP pyrophosphatase MutT (NUDIX family)